MGFAILEVAIGLVLVYFILSLVCSGISEFISQKLSMRGRKLIDGIRTLLGDPARTSDPPQPQPEGRKVAKKLRTQPPTTRNVFAHPLIRGLTQDNRIPSYIPPESFARALLDNVLGTDPEVSPGGDRARICENTKDDLQKVLLSFWENSRGDRERMLEAVEKWYDASMARVSGWYRRWSQKAVFFIALALVCVTNADSIRMGRVLSANPALRAALVESAKATVEGGERSPGGDPAEIRKEMLKIEPVLGWTRDEWDRLWGLADSSDGSEESADRDSSGSAAGNKPGKSGAGGEAVWVLVITKLFGLLITAFALTMGAPFWFKALQNLLRIREKLKPEDEKKPEEAATTPPGSPETPSKPGALPPPGGGYEVGMKGFQPHTARHSPANAYWLGRAAELAYRSKTEVKKTLEEWGIGQVKHLESEKKGIDTQAFVAADPRVVIVAFRGTEKKFEDIRTDARCKLATWQADGQVHVGFRDALDGIWPALVKAVKDLRDGGQSIWLTGHSLGGALATLAALRLATDDECADLRVNGVYTIGQPRCGDSEFSKAFESALPERAWRYVNNRDLVTRLPTRAQKYRHIGRIMYFDSTGEVHDDPGFWFRFLDTVVVKPDELMDRAKEWVADHGSKSYVDLLRRAAGPLSAGDTGSIG